MASESVGSCAASPPPKTPLADRPLYQQRGACFNCNQDGHWYRDCPSRRAIPAPPLPPAGKTYPVVNCPCGRGACIVLTSKTKLNPGRDFFKCPAEPKCTFFLWCDKVVSDVPSPVKLDRGCGFVSPVKRHLQYGGDGPWNVEKKDHGVQELPYPMCACGAGMCKLLIMEKGENAGRKYFGCPVKKGQGACSFRQWYENTGNTPEMMTENLGVDKFPNFNLVPEEPKVHEVEDGATFIKRNENTVKAHGSTLNAKLADNMFPNCNLVTEEPKEHEAKDSATSKKRNDVEIKGMASDVSVGPVSPVPSNMERLSPSEARWVTGEANGGGKAKGMPSDVSVVPASPSRSNMENRVSPVPGSELSPMKMLNLNDDGPVLVASRPGKCYRCNKVGHWMRECVASSFLCFKCGKAGHWRSDCAE